MRPFITFIGVVLLVPGWTLFVVSPSELVDQQFATPSGTVVWALAGSPLDIGQVHLYGILMFLVGMCIILFSVWDPALIKTPSDPL